MGIGGQEVEGARGCLQFVADDFGGVDVDEPAGSFVADLAAGARDELQGAGGGGFVGVPAMYVAGEDEVDTVVF